MIYDPKGPRTPFTACRLTWKDKNGKTFKYCRRENPRLEINVSSYVGTIAIGAMHYYGRIRGDSPLTYCVDDDKCYSLGGYGPDKPELYGVFEFDAKRKLTKIEKDRSGDIIGDVGDETSRFNTPNEAFEAAVKTAIKWFKDTKTRYWVVHFENCGESLDRDFSFSDDDTRDFRLSDLNDLELLRKFQWEGYSL